MVTWIHYDLLFSPEICCLDVMKDTLFFGDCFVDHFHRADHVYDLFKVNFSCMLTLNFISTECLKLIFWCCGNLFV